MFFHLKLLFAAFILLAGCELAIYKSELVFLILGGLLFISSIFNYRIIKNKRNLLLPFLFIAGTEILLFFISGMLFVQIFIAISTIVFYLIILGVYRLENYSKDETAHKINSLAALAVIFIWGAGLFAIFLNLNVPPLLISFLFYLIIVFTTYRLFSINIRKKKNFSYLLNSLLVAYCMLIICLAVLLLPFGYLTLGMLMLASYFLAVNYIIKKNNVENPLPSITVDVIIFILALGITLFTTRWSILE